VNPTFLYVAIVYAVAVVLARRGGADLPWRIAALFYGLTLLFFFKPLALDYINVPVDFLFRLPPWLFVYPHRFSMNGEMNDLALQIVPWAHQVRESWRHLQVPLWNSSAGCGYPLLANGQSSALSPLRLMTLPLSLGHAMAAEGAMKVLAALTFAYLFCRKRGYDDTSSAIGALSFGFSTFIIYWLHFPLVTVAAFLPAVFYAIELLMEHVSFARTLFLIAVWSMLLLGGHPETAAHCALFGLLYLVFAVITEKRADRGRMLIRVGATLFVAALIASPFLGPFLEAVTKSKRFQVLQVYPSRILKLDYQLAVLQLQPHFYGDMDERHWGPGIAEFNSGFAGVFAIAASLAMLLRLIVSLARRDAQRASDTPAEEVQRSVARPLRPRLGGGRASTGESPEPPPRGGRSGRPTLGRIWRERETFFTLMAPLVLGVALGVPFVTDAFHDLPLFSLAANGRLRLIVCWMMAVQAAALVDLIRRGTSVRYLLAGLGAVAAMISALFWMTDFPSAWAHDNSIAAALPSLLVLAAAAALVLIPRSRWSAAVVAFALVTELWSLGIRWNPAVPSEHAYPRTPMVKRIIELAGVKGNQPPPRVLGIGPYFFPNAAAIYGVEDIRTHDPMANGRYMGFLRVVAGYNTLTYFPMWEDMQTRVLDYLNVGYLMVKPSATIEDPERYREVFASPEGQIFENRQVLPRFFAVPSVILEFNQDRFIRRLAENNDWKGTAIVHNLKVESDRAREDLLAPRPANAPRATLQITSATATDFRMTVNATRWTLVVSSEAFWPGWRVTTGDRTLEPMQVNGPFLGFLVPPGRSDVRVVYDPISFKIAVAVSLLTIATLAIVSVGTRSARLIPRA
jgi:hypothetical protein